jgi:hypothetical protein
MHDLATPAPTFRRFPRVSRIKLLALAVLGGLALGIGCHPRRQAQTQTPEPKLCDLQRGRWCEPCGGMTGSECPAGDSGWLCCSGDACVVVATAGECTGPRLGWCPTYTQRPICNDTGWCAKVATCHDSA